MHAHTVYVCIDCYTCVIMYVATPFFQSYLPYDTMHPYMLVVCKSIKKSRSFHLMDFKEQIDLLNHVLCQGTI